MSMRDEAEKKIAIMEANLIHDGDKYFDARPNVNTDGYKTIFDAGYKRGWDASYKAATEAAQAKAASQQLRIKELEESLNKIIHDVDATVYIYDTATKALATIKESDN